MALDRPPGAGSASRLGNYELLKELAAGGIGSTWVARNADPVGAEPVTILRLYRHLTKRAELADNVLREAGLAQKVRSANVLAVLDARLADGEVFVVSEYAEGEQLSALTAAAPAEGLPLTVALRIGLDVLRALESAHAALPEGLVHGELNPTQIRVGIDGVTRVSGFGIARALAAITPMGAKSHERLAYAAPEHVKGMATHTSAPLDPRADLFSIGVILWELLSKQRLFSSKLESAVIQKVLTGRIPPLTTIAGIAVAPPVAEVVRRALERDPAQRFASAAEMRAELEAAGSAQIGSPEDVAALVGKLAGKTIEPRRTMIAAAMVTSTSPAAAEAPAPRKRGATLVGVASPLAEEPARGGDGTRLSITAPSPRSTAAAAPAASAAAGNAPVPGSASSRALAAHKDAALKNGSPARSTTGAVRSNGAATEEPADIDTAWGSPSEDQASSPSARARVETLPGFDAPADAATAAPAAAATTASAAAPPPRPAPLPPGLKEDPPTRAEVKPPIKRRDEELGASATPNRPAANEAASPRPVVPPRVSVGRPPRPPGPRSMAPTVPEVPSVLAALAAAPQSPATFASSLVAALPPPPAAIATTPVPLVAPPPPPATRPPPTTRPPPAALPPAARPPPAALPPDVARGTDFSPASSRTISTPTGQQSVVKQWGRAASAVDQLGPGSTLGRYEILMPVAKGGMAAVWAARLQGTRGFKKIVAIKTMLPDVSDDPDFESMFLDEARVAARIRHPNVVEILDLGEETDVLYLVMEWVDGETVSTLQKAARPLGGIPQRIALRIASQICSGLHNAHELRDDNGALVDLVHRDISPANVLISTAGFVKIVDFGVAKSKGRLHVTRAGGVIKGKTPYLSPEQLGGLPIDRRSDIFSLGALLYVLTTGLHPFRAETEMATVENIALKNPLAPRELNETIHPELDRIILKALEKDRANRFASCAEMQRAIDLVASTLGQPTTDDDVASFVRQAIGDLQAKRAQDLRDAIAAVDAGAAANSERRVPLIVEGQGPLDLTPASGLGIIPAAIARLPTVDANARPLPPASTRAGRPISSPDIVDEISFEEVPSILPAEHPPRLIIAASAQPATVDGAPAPAILEAPSPATKPFAKHAPKILPAAGQPALRSASGMSAAQSLALSQQRGRQRGDALENNLGEDTAVDRSHETAQRRKRLQFIVAAAATFCIALGMVALLMRGGEEHHQTGSARAVQVERPPAKPPAEQVEPAAPAASASPAPPPAATAAPTAPEPAAGTPEPEKAAAPAPPTQPRIVPTTRVPPPRPPVTARPTTKPTPVPRKKYNPVGI